ncbi:MAG: type II secretion system F family protein [Acidobacteriota bacterium]
MATVATHIDTHQTNNNVDYNLKLTDEELLDFTEEFRDMYEAGIYLVPMLRDIERATPNKGFSIVLSAIADSVQNGVEFSQALTKFPQIFEPYYIALIKAAETSGRWTKSHSDNGESQEGILDLLIAYIERRQQVKQRIKAGLLYPAIVAGLAIIAIAIFAFWILPALGQIFEALGPGSQGTIGSAMFYFGNLVINYWYLFPIAGIAIVAGIYYYFTTDSGKRLWNHWQLRLKVIGPIFQMMYLAEACWLMSTLFSAGLTPQVALGVVRGSVRNTEIAAAINHAADLLHDGVPFCDALKKSHPIFDGYTYQVLLVGQKTGNLASSLQLHGERSFKKLDRKIDMALRKLEPALIGLAGILVGILVIGFYSSIGEAIGRLSNR